MVDARYVSPSFFVALLLILLLGMAIRCAVYFLITDALIPYLHIRMATDLNLHRKSLVSGLDTEEGRARDLEVIAVFLRAISS